VGVFVADNRFFRRSGPFALGAIAEHVGAAAPLAADCQIMIADVASLDSAVNGEITLFSDSKYAAAFAASHASVVVTSTALASHPHNGSALLVVKDPKLAFAQIGHLFYPPPAVAAGIHPTAHIDPTATTGDGCEIGPGVVIGAEAKIGAHCRLSANVVIGPGVTMEDETTVDANTVISHAVIGSGVRIGSNTTIGGEGFGFLPGPMGLLRIAQLGRVVIENHVQIGNNCTIDRGAMGDTVIGAGSALDNMVHIAHNVRIGRFCVIAGQVGIAGSSTLGDAVMIGGQVGVNDHLTVGSGARIAAKSGVISDVAAGETIGGYPAVPIRQWHRQTVSIAKLGKPKVN
jgi:UDP-3-O-[3-hydroxymyristoyl] glucosamine N-acyltransferase